MKKHKNQSSGLEQLLSNPLILIIIAATLFITASPSFINNIYEAIAILIGVLILVAGGTLSFLWYSRQKELRKLKALHISQVDYMSGFEFEKYVGELLKFQGYQISFTPPSGDFGTDIIAKKGNDRISVQVKRYRGFVGIEAVQQAVASIAFYNCNKSMVVTNSIYSDAAKKLASATDCKLIDRNILSNWISNFQKSD